MLESGLLSLKLVLLVSLFSTFIGGSLAWSLKDSKGIFKILVGLPLVFSSLIYSFIFLALFDEFGLYEMRSLLGLSLILSLNITPYMYFSLSLGLNAFPESLKEALMLDKDRSFLKIFKIYSKFLFPFWGAGFGFLSLEVLSDFGASFLFGQETLSVYVYNLWLEQYDLKGAFSGFGALLVLVMLFFLLSLYFQKSKDLFSSRRKVVRRDKLNLYNRFFPSLYVLVAVLIPIFYLLYLSYGSWSSFDISKAFASFYLAFSVMLFSLIFFFTLNSWSLFPKSKLLKIPGVFYGVPGVLIGLSFYLLGLRVGLISLIAALSLKYFKFLTDYIFISWNSYSASAKFSRALVVKSRDQIKLDFKASKSFILVSMALIFVEVLKELPITLMIKPVSFQTLSTEIFTLVSEGDWELAAPYGVIVFLFGLVALVINQYFLNQQEIEQNGI